MRHSVKGSLWGRTANQRKALLRGLIGAILLNQRIETTVAKAKEIRRHVEKLVTMARRGDLHSKRLALSVIPNREAVAKLFADIAPRFANRSGGYMRIVRTHRRIKDQAEMAILEFVDYDDIKGTLKKPSKKSSEAEAPEKKKAEPKPKKEKAEKKPAAKKAAPKKEKPEAKPKKEKAGKPAPAKKAASKPKASAKKTGAKKTKGE